MCIRDSPVAVWKSGAVDEVNYFNLRVDRYRAAYIAHWFLKHVLLDVMVSIIMQRMLMVRGDVPLQCGRGLRAIEDRRQEFLSVGRPELP